MQVAGHQDRLMVNEIVRTFIGWHRATGLRALLLKELNARAGAASQAGDSHASAGHAR
jgi:hypothetical protein